MADLRISELPELLSADVAGTDLTPFADTSTDTTRKLTADGLSAAVIRLTPNGTLPGDKLVNNSVTAQQLALGAVGATELANGAVFTDSIQDGVVTDVKLASGINASKLTDGSVTGAKLDGTAFDRGLDKTADKVGHTNAVTPATVNGVTYDAQGHITAIAPITSADLPVASNFQAGVVSVQFGGGINVDGTGEISLSNTITPDSRNGLTWDSNGMLTNVGPIPSTDLPIATDFDAGMVAVPSAGGLEVNGAGQIGIQNSAVIPDTYTKVTVNQHGIVTAGAAITDADIPSLDASKLTTGTLDIARIADKSLVAKLLANNAVTLIQEGDPGASTDFHKGMLWFKESVAELRIWNGNSWVATGFGRLSAQNLRYCGTVNATTGNITTLTQFGTDAGFTVGDPVPTETDLLTGVYFVVDVAGSSIAVTPTVTYDAGDWVVCQGATSGWVRIDTLSGGGGGGTTLPNGTAAEEYLGWDNTAGAWEAKTTLDGGSF